MVTLGVANIGMVDIGTASISGHAFKTTHHKTGGASPIYKQILSKMPDELRKSLVCWYSPNLQGLTNAELYNSDNLYVGGLHDLSGNGHDMDLNGFDGIEGGGHVDADGNLCFDGVNDYGSVRFLDKFENFTCVLFGRFTKGMPLAMGGKTTAGNRNVVFQYANGMNRVQYVNSTTVNVRIADNDITIVDSSSVNDEAIITTAKSWSDYIFLGNVREGQSQWSDLTLRHNIWFNRILTNEEKVWIRKNMIVFSPPQPFYMIFDRKYNASSTISSTKQASACYANYQFQVHGTFDCIDVYDVSSKTKIQEIHLNKVPSWHCNSANFGSEYYDSKDYFPLLYISQEDEDEHKIVVCRIYGELGELMLDIVQYITLPPWSNDFVYYPNCCIDVGTNKLYVVGLANNPYRTDTSNIIKIAKFQLPNLAVGDTELSLSDIEDVVTYDNMPTPQGACFYNNKIWIATGLSSNAQLNVFDVAQNKLVMKYLLKNSYGAENQEPESCFVYNNYLYIAMINGYVYRTNALDNIQ